MNQNTIGKNKIPKNELNQFKDKLKIFVEGSKIENKFIIIFKSMWGLSKKKLFCLLLMA